MYNIGQVSNFYETIHEEYGNIECSIFLDSGGFQLITNSNPTLDKKAILKLVDKFDKKNPDLCMPLDFPQSLWLSPNAKMKRWSMTLESLKFFLKAVEEYSLKSEIVPVIHGYSLKTLSKAIRDIMALRCWNRIALGGQVGLLKKMYFVHNLGKLFCKNVKIVRDLIGENVWFHVLGAGGMRTLPIVTMLGADSGDGSGWEISASHGRVIVPKRGGSKYFPSQNREPAMSKDEIKLFNECNCPACESIDEDKILSFSHSKELRAVHNFFQLLDLERELQRVCEESNLLIWVKKRYKRSSIWPIIEYATKISELR